MSKTAQHINPKKILVIQQKRIGDVLVSTVICENLRKAYPNAQIDYLVYKNTTPVLYNHKEISNVIVFEEMYRKSKFEFFKFIKKIRKTRYDIIIDPYSKLESYLIVFFSKAKQKISFKKKNRTFLYTDNVPVLQKPKTNIGLIIERRLALLSPLDLDIDLDVVPKLYVSEEEQKEVETIFKDNSITTKKKTVMIAILGSTKSKTYPLSYMSKIVDFVADNADVNLLFNYIPSQVDEAKEIFDGCKESTQQSIYFNVIGDSLRMFIAIMNACDFIIGNDGGPINMAKALDKPAFTIFSPRIKKQNWSTFQDGVVNDSVHLSDFKPELLKGIPDKKVRSVSKELYDHFEPELIYPQLLQFLKNHISGGNVTKTDFNKLYKDQMH